MKKSLIFKIEDRFKLGLILLSIVSLALTYENCGGKFDVSGVVKSGSGSQSSNTPNQATLTWDAPTTDEAGNSLSGPITYNIYYGTGSLIANRIATNDGITKIAGVTSTSYVVSGLASMSHYCFVVTAENSAGESVATDPEACKDFPL